MFQTQEGGGKNGRRRRLKRYVVAHHEKNKFPNPAKLAVEIGKRGKRVERVDLLYKDVGGSVPKNPKIDRVEKCVCRTLTAKYMDKIVQFQNDVAKHIDATGTIYVHGSAAMHFIFKDFFESSGIFPENDPMFDPIRKLNNDIDMCMVMNNREDQKGMDEAVTYVRLRLYELRRELHDALVSDDDVKQEIQNYVEQAFNVAEGSCVIDFVDSAHMVIDRVKRPEGMAIKVGHIVRGATKRRICYATGEQIRDDDPGLFMKPIKVGENKGKRRTDCFPLYDSFNPTIFYTETFWGNDTIQFPVGFVLCRLGLSVRASFIDPQSGTPIHPPIFAKGKFLDVSIPTLKDQIYVKKATADEIALHYRTHTIQPDDSGLRYANLHMLLENTTRQLAHWRAENVKANLSEATTLQVRKFMDRMACILRMYFATWLSNYHNNKNKNKNNPLSLDDVADFEFADLTLSTAMLTKLLQSDINKYGFTKKPNAPLTVDLFKQAVKKLFNDLTDGKKQSRAFAPWLVSLLTQNFTVSKVTEIAMVDAVKIKNKHKFDDEEKHLLEFVYGILVAETNEYLTNFKDLHKKLYGKIALRASKSRRGNEAPGPGIGSPSVVVKSLQGEEVVPEDGSWRSSSGPIYEDAGRNGDGGIAYMGSVLGDSKRANAGRNVKVAPPSARGNSIDAPAIIGSRDSNGAKGSTRSVSTELDNAFLTRHKTTRSVVTELDNKTTRSVATELDVEENELPVRTASRNSRNVIVKTTSQKTPFVGWVKSPQSNKRIVSVKTRNNDLAPDAGSLAVRGGRGRSHSASI